MYIMHSNTLPHVQLHTHMWRDTDPYTNNHNQPLLNLLNKLRILIYSSEVQTYDLPSNEAFLWVRDCINKTQKAHKSTQVIYKEHQAKNRKEITKNTPFLNHDPTNLWNQPYVYNLHLYIP